VLLLKLVKYAAPKGALDYMNNPYPQLALGATVIAPASRACGIGAPTLSVPGQ
jgi:hypothetical protein